jgi:hypothetical protein
VTERGRILVLFLVAAVLVAGGAFAVGRATSGSDEPETAEAQPFEPASASEAKLSLASTPPVPALREPQQQSSGGSSGGGSDSGSEAQPTAPEAAAPAPSAPAPSAPAPAAPAPPAPQPEPPAAGE